MVNYSHRKMEEERRRIVAVNAFHVVEKSVQDLKAKLIEEARERKSAASALDSVERQAEGHRVLLWNVEDQLATSKEQILAMKKKLEEVQKAKDQAEKAKEEAKRAKEEVEQQRYDIGVAETEEALKAKVLGVCRTYCLQLWNETLNQAGVEASSVLRKAESVYYPLAIRTSSSSSSKPDTPAKVADLKKSNTEKIPPSSGSLPKVAEHPGVNEKGVEVTKEVASDVIMPPVAHQDPSKDKEAPRMKIVFASLPIPTKGDSKGAEQGSLEAAVQQSKAHPQGKIVIKKK